MQLETQNTSGTEVGMRLHLIGPTKPSSRRTDLARLKCRQRFVTLTWPRQVVNQHKEEGLDVWNVQSAW